MKIYTKTGDAGETGLFAGPRVRKDAARIEAYGTVDELNAVLGFARTQSLPANLDSIVARIQNELFRLGAELATPDRSRCATAVLTDNEITVLESEIDVLEAALAPLSQFILPGGTCAAAALHVARTVCRRAERRVVSLATAEPLGEVAIAYLNRLSDFLFVAARAANKVAGVADVAWQKDAASNRA